MGDDRGLIRFAGGLTQPDRDFEPGREGYLLADLAQPHGLRAEVVDEWALATRYVGVVMDFGVRARLSCWGTC